MRCVSDSPKWARSSCVPPAMATWRSFVRQTTFLSNYCSAEIRCLPASPGSVCPTPEAGDMDPAPESCLIESLVAPGWTDLSHLFEVPVHTSHGEVDAASI